MYKKHRNARYLPFILLLCFQSAFAQEPVVESETVIEPTNTAQTPTDENLKKIGTYKITLQAARPNFSESVDHYDEVYGKSNWYPGITVDWMPLKLEPVGLGLKFGMGSYWDNGNALRRTDESDALIEDDASNLSLTLVPFFTGVNVTLSPFSRRYITIDAWSGLEYLWYQEKRSLEESESSETGAARIAQANGKSFANTAWKQNLIVGASLNILLNSLEPQSVASLKDTLGLGYIYMSPFFQVARSLKDDGIKWERNEIGVSFKFESAR